MTFVLTNALLCDIDPMRVEAAELRIEHGRIVERGRTVKRSGGDELVDCGGAVVLPGLVNGHTHLYSALAVGMPPPPQTPRNFYEILKFVWWRLDRALDAESIETSARIGALAALRCGTTTLIDHHASPNCITGSLDLIEAGIADVGLRGVLCYETTDRHGPEDAKAGLDENGRYLGKLRKSKQSHFGGLVGAHASFTLEENTLDALFEMGRKFDAGIHIHVAEDPCDEEDCRKRFNASLIERLTKAGLAGDCVLAHCTHLDAESVAAVNKIGCAVAHNARSNMNNAVGYAPVASFRGPVMLGTDGIGADMFAEARAAWFISRHEQAGIAPADVVGMLAASARRASAALGVTLGKLEVGAAADIVVTDHVPFTPLTSENLAGHFIFSMGSQHVRHVMVDGAWRLFDRTVVGRDAAADMRAAEGVARRLWERMKNVAP